MNVKHQTRPTVTRIHAADVATHAAYQALLLGATPEQAATAYATAYADAMRG